MSESQFLYSQLSIPERYGKWSTVASRFYRWRKAGIWQTILTLIQQAADAKGQLDWQLNYVDGTVIRAHQHAAGARKSDPPNSEALGRSQGGFSTKVHLRAEGQGKLLTFVLTPVNNTKPPYSRNYLTVPSSNERSEGDQEYDEGG